MWLALGLHFAGPPTYKQLLLAETRDWVIEDLSLSLSSPEQPGGTLHIDQDRHTSRVDV